MPGGIRCRAGYRAVRDTVPRGTPCRAGYRAVRATSRVWDAPHAADHLGVRHRACRIARTRVCNNSSPGTDEEGVSPVPAQTWEGWPSPGADAAARCTAAAGCCGPPARRARRYRRCCKCRTCRSAHRSCLLTAPDPEDLFRGVYNGLSRVSPWRAKPTAAAARRICRGAAAFCGMRRSACGARPAPRRADADRTMPSIRR